MKDILHYTLWILCMAWHIYIVIVFVIAILNQRIYSCVQVGLLKLVILE